MPVRVRLGAPMNLYYNVLSEVTILYYKQEVAKLLPKNVWKSSNYGWNKELTEGLIGHCDSTFCSDELLYLVLLDINNLLPTYSNLTMQHCIWNKCSGIQFHEDSEYKFGATIYMNESWKPEWGGLFLWRPTQDSQNLQGFIPTYNSIVITDPKIAHMVTPVNSNAIGNRITLQLWAG